MPAAIWGIKHKDAHAPFVYEHPAENEKINFFKTPHVAYQSTQNLMLISKMYTFIRLS